MHFNDESPPKNELSSFVFVSADGLCSKNDLNNVIQVFDESGIGISYTYNKFVEIFDKKGLSGFIT